MIAKISTGNGFRGALDYIFKEDAVVIGGNMAGDDPRALSQEFGITRALREDIKKPCYHVSLALPKGEELDVKQWEKVATKYLARMGIDPLRFLSEFASRVYHVHGKDTEILGERLYEYGNLQPATFAKPLRFGEQCWRYTIPGHGQMRWTAGLRILAEAGYKGCVSVELEDGEFVGSEAGEKMGLTLARKFLEGC